MSLLGYATVHGTTATFRRVALGSYVPKTGLQAETHTDTTVQGILGDYDASEVGPGIDTQDRKFLLPASEITGGDPETEDRLIIGSVTYEIVRARRIDKHGAAEAYALQLRRAA